MSWYTFDIPSMTFTSAFPRLVLFLSLALVSLCFIPNGNAAGQTYTICASGCDYTSLRDALSTPGLGNDTLTLTSTYTFDHAAEDPGGYIPNGTTISCEAGAATFGDSGQNPIFFNTGSDFTLQNCTLENVNFDSTGGSNITYIGNTFTSAANSQLVFTTVDTFEIRDNILQYVTLQTADNGLITGNTFECRFNNRCISVVTAGSPDYSLSQDISSNVRITDNIFNNYETNSSGDWVSIVGGEQIEFDNNTVQSQVVVDDQFITMLTVTNAEVSLHHNYFFMPERAPNPNNGTWAINMRSQDYDTSVDIQNNTIFASMAASQSGNSCIGLFDDGSYTNIPVSMYVAYNACYQSDSSKPSNGISLNYTPGSADVALVEEYNGFHNISTQLNDQHNVYTANTSNISADPMYKTANIDSNDDRELSPISPYLDVQGTRDIGVYSGTRRNIIYIDANCPIDYIQCDLHTTSQLTDVVRSGDRVKIAEGTYQPFSLTKSLSNVTISGQGATSVIDGASGFQGITVQNVSNSTIEGLLIRNVTGNSNTYTLNSPTFSSSTQDYTNPPISVFLLDGCDSAPIVGTTNISAIPGVGTDDLNLFLVYIPGTPDQFISVYAASSFANSVADLSTQCGVPAFLIEHFVPSVFEVNNGEYTFNGAALSGQNISTTGNAPAPVITHTVNQGTAVRITNASNNVFNDITIANSTRGVALLGTSADNNIQNSDLRGSTIKELFSNTAGSTRLEDTYITVSKAEVDNTGSVELYFTTRAAVTANGNPISGATVELKDAQDTGLGNMTTDNFGNTPLSALALATILTKTNPYTAVAGGKNPMSFTVSVNNFPTQQSTALLTAPRQLVSIALSPATQPPTPVISTGGSGGGGYISTYSTEVPKTECSDCHSAGTSSGTLFSDLPQDDPDYAAFEYTHSIGAITGHSDNTVRADTHLQRDEAVKIVEYVFKMYDANRDYCAGTAPFPDIQLTDWSAQYACLGKQLGIITGYKDAKEKGRFYPERTINRAEFLAMILRGIEGLRAPKELSKLR